MLFQRIWAVLACLLGLLQEVRATAEQLHPQLGQIKISLIQEKLEPVRLGAALEGREDREATAELPR
jgi:hypothetical protein